jgi:predicted MFS family arabinose efflux permease
MTYLFASPPLFLMAASFWMPRTLAIIVVAIAGFWGVMGIVAFNVVQVSMRQKQSPPRMLARMTASIRMLIWGVGPLGALLSGIVATKLGLAAAFWIGAIGETAGVLFLLLSPLWRLRDVPDPEWLLEEQAGTSE